MMQAESDYIDTLERKALSAGFILGTLFGVAATSMLIVLCLS